MATLTLELAVRRSNQNLIRKFLSSFSENKAIVLVKYQQSFPITNKFLSFSILLKRTPDMRANFRRLVARTCKNHAWNSETLTPKCVEISGRKRGLPPFPPHPPPPPVTSVLRIFPSIGYFLSDMNRYSDITRHYAYLVV